MILPVSKIDMRRLVPTPLAQLRVSLRRIQEKFNGTALHRAVYGIVVFLSAILLPTFIISESMFRVQHQGFMIVLAQPTKSPSCPVFQVEQVVTVEPTGLHYNGDPVEPSQLTKILRSSTRFPPHGFVFIRGNQYLSVNDMIAAIDLVKTADPGARVTLLTPRMEHDACLSIRPELLR
jgi:biopolymer transport protein ExbD